MDAELSQPQRSHVHEIICRIFDGFCDYRIFPPKEVTSNPGLLSSPTVFESLRATKWWITIADGGEEILTFLELLSLIYQIRHAMAELSERQPSEYTGPILLPALSSQQLLQPSFVKGLLDSVELEGLGHREKEYCAKFPLFALSDNSLELTDLIGVDHPQSGLPTVFIFTDLYDAERFAAQFGRGTVVKIADDEKAFRNVLQRGNAQAVAFDPVIYDGVLQVKFQALVSGIIESADHESRDRDRLSKRK